MIQKIILALCLLLSVFIFSTAANSAELLPVSSKKVVGFTVKPNHLEHASQYTLKLYSDDDMKQLLLKRNIPMRGNIIDVNMVDIDNDHYKEIVVTINQGKKTKILHNDVFNFAEEQRGVQYYFSRVLSFFD